MIALLYQPITGHCLSRIDPGHVTTVRPDVVLVELPVHTLLKLRNFIFARRKAVVKDQLVGIRKNHPERLIGVVVVD